MKRFLMVLLAVTVSTSCDNLSTQDEALNLSGSLVSYWKFDEGAGTIARDLVGGNDGALGDTLGNRPTWVEGIVGHALEFDGVDDFVKVQDNPSLDITDAITIEAWVKFNGNTDNRIILTKNWDGMSAPYHFSFEDNAWIGTGLRFGVQIYSEWHAVLTSVRPAIGEWLHLAGTFDGTVLRYYVNGLETGSMPWAGAIIPNDFPLAIGAQTDWHWLGRGGGTIDGVIDEVAIYDRALTQAEIDIHYRNGSERGMGYQE